MRRIDGKLLKNNLKKGWTISDFASYCDMSVEEFRNCLQKKFSESYLQPIWRDLKKNEKAWAKTKKNAEHKSNYIQVVDKKPQILTEEQKINFQQEELKEKERKIRGDLCSKEKEYKSLQDLKKESCRKLQEQRNFLDEIYRQIKEKETIVLKLMKESQVIDEAMAKNRVLKLDKEKELQQVLDKIKSLKKVSIKCYSDGRVECEELQNQDLDWSQKFENLTEDTTDEANKLFIQIRQLAEDLPVKEVKQLAKLLTLFDVLKEQGKKYCILFEEETQVSALLELVDIQVKILN